MRYLIFAALLAATTAVAEPLPRHEGTHLYALTQCGVMLAVVWVDEEGAYVVPAGSIRTEEAYERILAAREAAMEDGTAYQVEVPGGECQRT